MGDSFKRLGDYLIGEQLGAGAMGVVFRGEHAETGARVAIKTLHPQANADALLRLKREGEAQATVDRHPNVIRIRSAGVFEGRAYLVMDLAEGGSLAERLRTGPLPLREAATLIRDLARGLAHVHAHGVLHRDLKPDNVLFETSGTPKLVDFGVARLEDAMSLTESGALLGTPAFMSPEQAIANRGEVGPASDVYGLGAILYATLTGEPPFRGASTLKLLCAVVEEPPTPPGRLRPDLDASLEAICLRCLEKRPADRYDSADALADALDLWLSGKRAPRRSRRPALALALALTAAACAVAAWSWAPPPPRTLPRGGTPRQAPPQASPAAPATEDPPLGILAPLPAEPLAVLAHGSGWTAAAFLDDSHLITSGDDDRLRTWDLARAREGAAPEAEAVAVVNPVLGMPFLAVGPDVVVLGGSQRPLTWIRAGRLSPEEPGPKVGCMATSPRGRHLAVGTFGTSEVVRFDVQTGAQVGERVPIGDSLAPLSLAYSPDGGTLAVLVGTQDKDSSWLGNTAFLYDLELGHRKTVSFKAPGRCVAMAPDGKHLVVGTTIGQILWLDLATGELVRDYRDPSPRSEALLPVAHPRASMRGIVFGRTGRRCYSVARADSGSASSLALWVDGELVTRRERPYYPQGAELSPNGRLLAIPTRNGVVEVWRVR